MLKKRNDRWQGLVDSQKAKVAKSPIREDQIDSYYFIFNCFDNEIEYVNNAFEILTQYPTLEFGIEKLLGIVHPDDLQDFFESEQRGLDFFDSLSFNQHFRYLLSHSFRIKTANGVYIRIRHQCQAIEVDSRGYLSKTLIMHQKTIEKFDPIHDYKVFDRTLNKYIDTANFYNLTSREQQVLELVQNGYSSVEIASHLSVSKYTVDTHRKNILNKTNASNFMELTKKLKVLS